MYCQQDGHKPLELPAVPINLMDIKYMTLMAILLPILATNITGAMATDPMAKAKQPSTNTLKTEPTPFV